MSSRLVTVVLLAVLGWGSFELIPRLKSYPLPGNQQGYAPEQPIAFSHRLHAGELKIACLYCHFGAEKGQHAGFPATSICMNCHRLVSANWDATSSRVPGSPADEPAAEAGRVPRSAEAV